MKNALMKNLITPVWLLLMAITAVSWFLGTNQSGGLGALHEKATLGVFVLSFFKVRLVILHFMEVRHAPLPLRIACEAWVLVICAVLITIYLSAVPVPVV